MYSVPSIESEITLLLDMLFVTTQFLRHPLCNSDASCNGSGNHVPVNFTFSKTTLESSAQQWRKSGWFVQSFTWQNLAFVELKSIDTLNNMENAFSINNAAHSAQLSLWWTQKWKKKNTVLCFYTDPRHLWRDCVDQSMTGKDLKLEMWDLRGVFYYSEFSSFFIIHQPWTALLLRVQILKVSHIDAE